MSIKGEDNRSIVTNFNVDGIDAVVGIDLLYPVPIPNSDVVTNVSTGSLIAPNYVLTAGHVIFKESKAKVRLGEDAVVLSSRSRTPILNFNTTNFSYPAPGFNGNDRSGIGGKDLGLITLNQPIGKPSQYIGLAAFVDPQDAQNFQVTTAGFPGSVEDTDFSTNEDGTVNLQESASKNAQFLITDENGIPSESLLKPSGVSFLTDAVKMFTATGTIDSVNSDGQFSLNETLDAEQGQSGSGFWTYLEGDTVPRLVGVYSASGGLFKDNIGALITTDAYDNIVKTMRSSGGSNLTGKDLPESAIIGSGENDTIKGSYLRERILGNEGQDTISAGEADDRLEGGAGYDVLKGEKGNDRLQGDGASDFLNGGEGNKDIAVFSDEYTTENYKYEEISGSTFGVVDDLITIEHIGGTYADGKDTLDGIEWGAFKGEQIPLGNARLASEPAPRIIPLPLEDGELETKSVKAVDTTPSPNTNDLPTPPYVSLTAPVAMLDGNVDFTLNISPYKPNIEYNIAYIFDTSASMDSGELLKAKNAYTDLTNYFINSGLAENINFGVVKFSRYATLYENLTAEQAISTIQGLTSSPAIEGTKYNDALYQGMNFLSQSPIKGATNIAYFVSDGRSQTNFADPNDVSYVYDAQNLRRVSNVQAFGIYDSTDPGGVTSSQINFVDSNNGVLVNNINDLSTELNKSGLAGKVSQVNILVDDVVVDTIQASELTDGPLGLTYEGSVEDLDVSANAKNVITAEVVFNDNTATTAVDYTVTAGQGKLTDSSGNPIDESGNTSGDEDPFERMRNGGDSNDEITIGYADKGASGGAGADYIVGNKRDNTLDGGVGNDTIKGHRGNDTIITGAGTNKVDGGDGIDTAVYGDVVYQGNTSISLRQAADTVSYNNTDTLTDVEYIQFSDVRISAKTLQVTPILQGNEVNLTEAKTGTTTAQFTFNLSTPAPVDVVFNYNTVDGDAVAGQDYLAKTGQVIISAGNTSVTVEVEIIGDNQYNESTETFALNLSSITGATFANNETEYTVAANIQNRPEDLNLVGDAGQNTLTGGQGNDTLDGKENNDYLSGEAGNDSLIGGTGLDTLVGGSGNDIMTGDTGNDTYVVDVTGDTITETSTTATEIDTVQSSVTYSLGANLENLTLTGTGVTNGSGNTLSNTITGNTANNTLIGNTGNDTVIGGLGDDLITGGYGSDFLIGEGGNDTMAGGVANDTYVVDTTGDSVEETSTITTEIDTVQAGITYTLGSNLEKLTLTGTSAINATGNTLNNTLTGNAANNTLVGGAGIDTMAGGTGNDTYVVDNTGDVVSENSTLATEIDTVQSNHSHTLSANVENLTLTGIYGTGGSGNSLNNNLTGNSGNNSLWGGAGIDTMAGGTGNDTYFVDNTRDVVSETSTLATEIDTVQSNHSHALSANVENLILTGTYGTGGSGNSLNNTITGNAANNTLAGGTGSDIMAGGTGNDTYVVDNTGDVVSETSTLGTEIDTVQSGISHTLSANVENLTLTSSYGIGGYGNSLNNNMTGNIANNVLVGNEGNDTLNGSDGDDQLYGKVGSDLLLGGQGNDYFSGLDGLDTIYGDQGNDSINGGNDRDVLFGGTENDTLIGGVSNDTMTGGADSDRFIYDTNAAFTTNALGIDQITDFVNGTDKIVLDKTTFTTLGSVVGGGFSLASEFAVVGSDSAAATADAMIVYSSESDNLFYNQNGVTAGLGSGAQFATLSGISGLNGDDFVLQA